MSVDDTTSFILILAMIGVSTVATFGFCAFFRSKSLSALLGVVLTETLLVVYALRHSSRSWDYGEATILVDAFLAVVLGTPIIVCTSIGISFLARRFFPRPSSGISEEGKSARGADRAAPPPIT